MLAVVNRQEHWKLTTAYLLSFICFWWNRLSSSYVVIDCNVRITETDCIFRQATCRTATARTARGTSRWCARCSRGTRTSATWWSCSRWWTSSSRTASASRPPASSAGASTSASTCTPACARSPTARGSVTRGQRELCDKWISWTLCQPYPDWVIRLCS